MKRNVLLILSFCLFSVVSFSQKSSLQKAINYYKEPYQQYDKAKDYIDEAVVDEDTKSLDKTWYYRGLIYQAIYSSTQYQYLCDRCLETAYEAFLKANQINPTNEWVEEINAVQLKLLGRDFFNRGVDEFKASRFKDALISFEAVQKILPNDTSVVLNSAYAAERAGDKVKAKQYYSRLISMKYRDDKVYLALTNIYKQDNDSASALATIRDGRKFFPDSLNLILTEINILLGQGRSKEAGQLLDLAIKKDPNNASLYLAQGSTYDNLANPKDIDGFDLARPSNYEELINKAQQAYLRGLQVSPESFELNYNLGAIYFNQAAEMANAANSIKAPEEYKKAEERFQNKFRDAQPYLEKAQDANPKDKSTLMSLRQLYQQTNQIEKYKKVKATLDTMR